VGAQELTLATGGDWGFGQNRQGRKCGLRLHIIVDVVGRYIQNGSEEARGDEEQGRKGGKRDGSR